MKKMNLLDLGDLIASDLPTFPTQRVILPVIRSLFRNIRLALKRGDEIHINKLGVFLVKQHPGGKRVTNFDGTVMQSKEKRIPKFKASPDLIRELSNDASPVA